VIGRSPSGAARKIQQAGDFRPCAITAQRGAGFAM